MKKPAKAKKIGHLEKALRSRASKAMKTFYMFDGDVLETPHISQYQTANMSVNKFYDCDPDYILSCAKYTKQHWQIVKFAFCDDGVQQYVKRYKDTDCLENPKSVQELQDEGRMRFDKVVESQNPNHLKSVGYIACSGKDIDIDDLADQVIPVFERNGCYNLEIANLTIKTRDYSKPVWYGDSRAKY